MICEMDQWRGMGLDGFLGFRIPQTTAGKGANSPTGSLLLVQDLGYNLCTTDTPKFHLGSLPYPQSDREGSTGEGSDLQGANGGDTRMVPSSLFHTARTRKMKALKVAAKKPRQ